MSKVCELCKTENPDKNQFCEKCGNPLDGGGEATEKKQEETAGQEDQAAEPGEVEMEEEEEAAPKSKSDMKLLLIPIALVLIVLVVLGLNYYQKMQRKKEATALVQSYMSSVKAGNYSDALEQATGVKMSAEWEKAFKQFLIQLTPPMPINEKLHEAKVKLVKVSDGIERYYYINRNLPSKLEDLTPVIMEELPKLPMGEYGYEYDNNAGNYTVFVKGDTFSECGLDENFPAYSWKDKLQSPGEKKVFGEWAIRDYEILKAVPSDKKVKVTVRENAQFGPTQKMDEDTYKVKKEGEKWQIDIESSNINLMSFTLAFTQMEKLGEPEKKEEKEGDKKEKKKEKGKAEEKEGKGKEREEKKVASNQLKFPLGMALLTFSKITRDPKNLELRHQYQLRKCREALSNIGIALGSYYRDHDGTYPKSLQWLIPKYLNRIPDNPAAMEDTFSEGYEVSFNQQVFTVYSVGNYYKSLGLENGFPQYSSLYRYVESPDDVRQKEKILMEKLKQERQLEGPGGQQMGPGGQPIGPGGQQMGPGGQQMGPGGQQQMGPGGQRMGPGGQQQMGPGGQRMGPGGQQQMGPGGQQMGPGGQQQMGPGGQQMGPGGQQMGPGGQQMGPGGQQQMGPGGQQQMRPGGQMGPGGQQMGPGGQQMGPGGQQMGPGGQRMGPGGQQQMGPGGQQQMGPGGQQMRPGGQQQQMGPGGQQMPPPSPPVENQQ